MDRNPEAISTEIERRNAAKGKILRQIALMQEAADTRVAEIQRNGEEIRQKIHDLLENLDGGIRRSVQSANSIFDRHRSELMLIVNHLDDENGRDKAFLVIGKFPVEILSYIFEECIKNNTSPWTLAKVCKFWHRTALGTYFLWNTICIVSSLSEYIRIREIPAAATQQPRSYCREQVCICIEEVKAATKRAGNGPLNIRLAFGRPVPGEDHLRREKPIYELLFNSTIASRIKSLELCNEGIRNFNTISGTFRGPLPALETLIMSSSSVSERIQPIVEMIVQHAPNLSNIEFSALAIPEGMKPVFWGRLKRIHVSISTNVDKIFSETAEVEELTGLRDGLGLYGNTWPTSSTSRTAFTHLRELEIIVRCVSHIARIDLPALTRLDILVRVPREGLQQQSPPEFSLQLPMLTSLTIRALECRSISQLVMPNLQSLNIISEAVTKATCEEDLNHISNSGLLGSITTFELSAPLTDKGLVTVFTALKAAETIRLTPGKRLGYPLVEALAVTRRMANKWPTGVVCPQLTNFYLELSENSTKTSEPFWGKLKSAITSRRMLPKTLEKVEIKRQNGAIEDWANVTSWGTQPLVIIQAT